MPAIARPIGATAAVQGEQPRAQVLLAGSGLVLLALPSRARPELSAAPGG